MKKTYFLALLLPAICFSQTKEEREIIASQSNKAGNELLAKEFKQISADKEFRIAKYLQDNPTAKRIVRSGDAGTEILTDVLDNGEPFYTETYNDGAATTARTKGLYSGGSLGLNIQGQGMLVGVWDGGPVRDSHQEFLVNGFTKINILNFGLPTSWHATHVSGTIAAQGINPLVRGLAFNASINEYDFNNDMPEILLEASAGLLMSNHSYGPGLTSNASLWVLGAYNSSAQQIDQICFNNPFYLPVWSAGNSRNDTDIPYSTQITQKLGYDLVASSAIGKNVLTVAAVNNVATYTDQDSVTMSSFSSYGPSDDGRIKPEISTKGVNVLSTTSDSDTSTGFSSGTSMSAPGITGVVTLLQQYYNSLYGNYMKAATVKGLIMHSADEAGGTLGPDYGFGWGLVNATEAAKIIRDKNLTTGRSIIREGNLANGGTYSQTFTSTSNAPVRISISWTDPAAPVANTGTIDPPTIYLVNDLDIKVTSATGTVYYPWKLQGLAGTLQSATNNSTNNVDNFERVDIPNTAGTYTITVSHKGTLTNGSQNFTLLANGRNITTLGTSEANIDENQLQIYPNPSSDVIFIKNTNNAEAQLKVLDMAGRLVLNTTTKEGKINIKSLKAGNYMLLYKDNKNQEKSWKFIKK
ncbi:S8 family serine peptidase [Frigoriflavimonas asaccharolytica]|uniref:Secreted protein (Por secretion system target) n=1 Tax=Frigoriflavimonas asaccharolytica TaxID=2735899 RepID=A0A8J8GBK9_9FLAO|nr:S8 family serine peptidase [Frigoriflavimonas asaccharolytica]NRS92692.1 hypothetical protein [Frigoriflavimonas asaccharolytica]